MVSGKAKEVSFMNKVFNIDNPVMQFLSKVFDLIILNLFFLLGCVPVVTVGASLCGLYYVSLKMVREDSPYIWKNFWKAFRQNFRQGTAAWFLSLLIAALLGMDFYILNSRDTVLFAVVRVLLWVVCAVLLGMFLYLFPILSHFVCTIGQALKNALFMAFGYLPYTGVLLTVCGLIIYFLSASSKTAAVVLLLSGICGFSVFSFSACLLFDRIFRRYEPGSPE